MRMFLLPHSYRREAGPAGLPSNSPEPPSHSWAGWFWAQLLTPTDSVCLETKFPRSWASWILFYSDSEEGLDKRQTVVNLGEVLDAL